MIVYAVQWTVAGDTQQIFYESEVAAESRYRDMADAEDLLGSYHGLRMRAIKVRKGDD